MNGTLIRGWHELAPKVITFLATGLTSSALIAALHLFGIEIRPTLAVLVVGGISSVAAYIVRDKLLDLAPGQLSLKVLRFIVTSASAVTIVALAGQFGLDLSQWSPLIGVGLTLLGSVLGYTKSDVALAA